MVPEFDLSLVLSNIAASVERGDVPGAVVLVAGLDRIHAFESTGEMALGGPSLRTDALFRIASMTKPIVSAAAMQFIDAGRLRLDDPIGRYLPELATLTVQEDLAGKDAVPAGPVTVFDLLTHRAGFAYPGTAEGPLADMLRAFNAEFLPAKPEGAWLQQLGATPLMHQPGEAFTYGFSTDVLGLLLARLEDLPLGDVLKRKLFEPLGMEETAFRVGPENAARLPRSYLRDPFNGELAEVPPELDCQHAVRNTFESGGAGLVSTARDYLRFARFMQNGLDALGRKLLSSNALSLMTSNHLTQAQRQRGTFGIAEYWAEQGFGLGVAVLDRPGPARFKSVGRYGWAGAYGTFWVNEPRAGLTALLMTQVMTLDAQPAYELQFEADLHEALR